MTNVLNEMHNVSPYLERKGLIGDFFLLVHCMIGGGGGRSQFDLWA
jgi:hypothetical protein